MKRSVVIVLAVSLFALPLFAAGSKAQCVSLEHVRGAWRMQIRCEQGVGAIALTDTSSTKSYSGEGVFSNWSQEQLGAMYESLVPRDSDAATELMQLG
jgi:hypothetical protein